jgi:hypothetical protein
VQRGNCSKESSLDLMHQQIRQNQHKHDNSTPRQHSRHQQTSPQDIVKTYQHLYSTSPHPPHPPHLHTQLSNPSYHFLTLTSLPLLTSHLPSNCSRRPQHPSHTHIHPPAPSRDRGNHSLIRPITTDHCSKRCAHWLG